MYKRTWLMRLRQSLVDFKWRWTSKDGLRYEKPLYHSTVCVLCKRRPTTAGHDPCIANLPGVDFACCGHGGEGYVKFSNGQILRGYWDHIEDANK